CWHSAVTGSLQKVRRSGESILSLREWQIHLAACRERGRTEREEYFKSPLLAKPAPAIIQDYPAAGRLSPAGILAGASGAWRSWLARFLDMEKVTGSSPVAPILFESTL